MNTRLKDRRLKRKDRKVPKITSIAAPLIAAMAIGSAPAQAAPDMHRHYSGDAPVHYAGFGQAINLRREINRLDNRIERALANHRISWREANGLKRDVDRLENMLDRFQRGGLTRWEARTLESRIAEVDYTLRRDRRDRDGRRG